MAQHKARALELAFEILSDDALAERYRTLVMPALLLPHRRDVPHETGRAKAMAPACPDDIEAAVRYLNHLHRLWALSGRLCHRAPQRAWRQDHPTELQIKAALRKRWFIAQRADIPADHKRALVWCARHAAALKRGPVSDLLGIFAGLQGRPWPTIEPCPAPKLGARPEPSPQRRGGRRDASTEHR